MEIRVSDGDKPYFKRSVSNFFRLNTEVKALKESISGVAYDGVDDFQLNTIPDYFLSFSNLQNLLIREG